jgi:Flp pilus assembly protein TadD
MTRLLAIALLAAGSILAVPAAYAVGDDSPSPPGAAADPDAEAGKAAIRGKDWNAAIAAFGKVAAKDPKDANAQNWLGYAYRMSGQLDLAFKHYGEALRLDPRHRGAHEYIGEAYLMKGDLAKAKEHLAQLDRICFFGCGELNDLKQAIAAYQKQKK